MPESTKELFQGLTTPFDAIKTAPQDIDFAIDPSFGLTKRRYGWYSNNTLFDDTHFTDIAGGIQVATSATASDTARLRSAFAGQYVSQTIGVPGQGLHINSGVTKSGGQYSLDNGIVAVGAGWHDGSSGGWDVGGTIQTFIGLKWDTTGLKAIHISDGSHVSGSPVDQSNFNIDSYDGTGRTGNEIDPSRGYIYNQPYTWYNEGALIVGVIDPLTDRFHPMHQFEGVDGAPNLDRPNIPTIVILDNDGTATSTDVTVGGMQYSRYGSTERISRQRQTPFSRITSGGYIGTTVTENNSAVDVLADIGTPLYGIQRKDTKTGRQLGLTTADPFIQVDNAVYIVTIDEWDYDSATGSNSNLREPHAVTNSKETRVNVDTELTSYTPSTFTVRGFVPVEGGQNKEATVQEAPIESRVPIDASRIVTALNQGSNADLTAMQQNIIEAF